ncbi:MAG: DUF4333 domain-containing protein [Polyangiales bacterium]
MINRNSFAAVLVAFVVAAPLLGGCKSKIDSKKLETAIADGMKGQSIPTKSVTCPADREAKKGDTFECDAVTEKGDTVKVKIEQVDDQGNVNWKVDAPAKPKEEEKAKAGGDEGKPAAEEDKKTE